MSMAKCKCDKIYDTDFEMEVDADGNCICDDCAEELELEKGEKDERILEDEGID